MIEETLEVSIKYSGEATKNNTMDAKEFAVSLKSFCELIDIISNEYGIKDNEIKMEIKDIKKGSLEAILIFLAGTVSGHYIGKVLNKLDDKLVKIYKTLTKFVKAKKEISNKLDIKKIRIKEDLIINEMLSNPRTYELIYSFAKCLNNNIEKIDIKTNSSDLEEICLDQEGKQNILYVPLDNEKPIETILNEEMILFLDGLQGSSEKWKFIKKTKSKQEKITAEVLSKELLEFGKDTPYTEYSETPLLCDIIIKKFKKDGAKKDTITYHIVSCSINAENNDLLKNIKQ